MGDITGPIRNPQNARFHWYISPTFFGFDHSRLLVGPSRPASFLSDSNICCFLEILSSTPHSVYILEAFQNAQGLHLVMMEYDGMLYDRFSKVCVRKTCEAPTSGSHASKRSPGCTRHLAKWRRTRFKTQLICDLGSNSTETTGRVS